MLGLQTSSIKDQCNRPSLTHACMQLPLSMSACTNLDGEMTDKSTLQNYVSQVYITSLLVFIC